MVGPLLGSLALVSALAGPANDPSIAASPARVAGFAGVVISHINHTMGTENLPAGRGGAVQPGVFVTLSIERMQIFDNEAVPLQQGRPADPEPVAECAGRCPASFYDAFQERWLSLAVEASWTNVEIPSRVHFGAHAQLPAQTLLAAAYAAAVSRPITPPQLLLLLNSPGRGLQTMPFFLVPPGGLQLGSNAGAVLALTIEFEPGRYRVHAADPDFAQPREVGDLKRMRTILGVIKKKYPGKDAVILEPGGGTSVAELVSVAAAASAEGFDRVVLGAGQDVIVP